VNGPERRFQAYIVRKLRRMFPGCIILMNDPNYLQGVPDLLLLWRQHWAALECKASNSAKRQPNQEEYVDLMDAMSFASFINPANEEQVLHDLQHAFESRGPARVSERQQVSLDKLRRRQADRVVQQRTGS
jgi:hypothetical protein